MYPESISCSGRLHDVIMADIRRISEKILGRPLSRQDSFLYVYHMIISRIVEPQIFVSRLVDIIKSKLGLPLITFDIDRQ